MATESSSTDLISRLRLSRSEVSVARAASKLIRRYRLKTSGAWSGPTADQLVRREIGDPLRQISVLSLACVMEKETRATRSPSDDAG